jgi:hypothetical protein
MFQNLPWIFQLDSAHAHKAKTTQQWLENEVPKFISSDHWLSSRPDFNPLYYKLWSRRHHNQETLKQVLVEAVDNFPMDVVYTAIDE